MPRCYCHCLASLACTEFNAAANMIYSTSRCNITHQLHVLRPHERMDCKLAIPVTTVQVPELSHSSYSESRLRLRSASSLNMIVLRTTLSTYGDHDRLWKSLPSHVKSTLSVNIFKTRLRNLSSLAVFRNYSH